MNLPERGPDQVRIGIAIQVPEPFGAQLREARAAFRDSHANAIPPHVTLLGPTVIEAARLAEVDDHLGRIAADTAPFEVYLRGSATFRPLTPVVFIQLVKGIVECEQLERAVRSGPLDVPVRFNYHPHVTVAHEVADVDLDRAFDEMADYAARFTVEGIQFYEHDGVWQPRTFHAFAGSRGGLDPSGP